MYTSKPIQWLVNWLLGVLRRIGNISALYLGDHYFEVIKFPGGSQEQNISLVHILPMELLFRTQSTISSLIPKT